jgi:hypothetical protein
MASIAKRSYVLAFVVVLIGLATLSLPRPVAAARPTDACRIPTVLSGKSHGILNVPFEATPRETVTMTLTNYLFPVGPSSRYTFDWRPRASIFVNGNLVATTLGFGNSVSLVVRIPQSGNGLATFKGGPGYNWALTINYGCLSPR